MKIKFNSIVVTFFKKLGGLRAVFKYKGLIHSIDFGGFNGHYFDRTGLLSPSLNHLNNRKKQIFLKRTRIFNNNRNSIFNPDYFNIRVLYGRSSVFENNQIFN